MIGVGVDVVSLDQMRQTLDRSGVAFLARVFSAEEQGTFPDGPGRLAHIASRFAVKEAAFKCLSTTWAPDASFTDIVVVTDEAGCPHVHLVGALARALPSTAAGQFQISLSVAADTAVAIAVLT